MAAYNCGAGAVDRAVERTGYADYWELLRRHALPQETANYVPIILAMTIIAKNPQDYGLRQHPHGFAGGVRFDSPDSRNSCRFDSRCNLTACFRNSRPEPFLFRPTRLPLASRFTFLKEWLVYPRSSGNSSRQ